MKPETLEWIEKADGDWATMMREAQVEENPNFDAVCFHAQQCAEKYVKARLVESNINFRKTHDLLNLLNNLIKIDTTWNDLEETLGQLSVFAVAYRYPGYSATKEQSLKSVNNCRLIRETVRLSFGLSV
jgi:HEPN domain-containing protein